MFFNVNSVHWDHLKTLAVMRERDSPGGTNCVFIYMSW